MADFRVLPSIEQLRQRSGVLTLERKFGQAATRDALRAAAQAMRTRIAEEEEQRSAEVVSAEIEGQATAQLQASRRGTLRAVINATGVVIHTNLGRAPLSASALARVTEVASGYATLEYDIVRGQRGSRAIHAEALLCRLTGAEAAIVVNNNAAATLLILSGLASGREVVISRGELVEIGGGFRVPDVLQQSGAVLREVGTTNRTRAADYRAAIGPATALLMRVHPSNFTISGFTARPSLGELVRVAQEAGIALVEDLGSGNLSEDWPGEPTIRQSVAAGADVVCFSGDKLLGGPQAGIIVGRRAHLERLAGHPLMRALRVDKLTLAALEGTLIEHWTGAAHVTIPVLRMLTLTNDAIARRAHGLHGRLQSSQWQVDVRPGSSVVGGGSAPHVQLSTTLVTLRHRALSAGAGGQQLRQLDTPVIARVEDDRLVLDLRTVFDEQDDALAQALLAMD